MTTPLTAQQLASLLDILADPEHPSFIQALDRLTELDVSTLTPELATSLQARLQNTIAHLTETSTLTAQQLTNLRRGNQALKSYGSK
ncbi:MAG: hypothetical protein EON60_00350 [Alphaproteobacteria bacterium]|nr:MAG: hypothetical protein EON60_00350 [Alphaproteobacteria bacterium]